MDHPLKRLADERGLKQYQIASALQFSGAFISDLIKGKVKPGRVALTRIWRTYQIPPEQLLDWEPPGGWPPDVPE